MDIPRLDRLHLIFPQRNSGLITQQVGRAERKHPDKQDALIYDYWDGNVGPLDVQWRVRHLEVYKSRGYRVATRRPENAEHRKDSGGHRAAASRGRADARGDRAASRRDARASQSSTQGSPRSDKRDSADKPTADRQEATRETYAQRPRHSGDPTVIDGSRAPLTIKMIETCRAVALERRCDSALPAC